MRRRKLLKTAAALPAEGTLMPLVVEANDEIVIAQIHDQSGGLDIYGNPMVQAFDLAVAEINEKGGVLGRPLRAINYDPQSNCSSMPQLAQQAALRDRVAVVHGGITSASREVIRPVLRRFDTLYFYNSSTKAVSATATPSASAHPAQTVAKLVPYVIERFGPRIYSIAATTITARSPPTGCASSPRRAAARWWPPTIPAGRDDFGPTISRIQTLQPDLVMSILVGGGHVAFYRQWVRFRHEGRDPDGLHHLRRRQRAHHPDARGGQRHHLCLRLLSRSSTRRQQRVSREARGHVRDNHAYMSELPCSSYEGVHIWAKAVEMAGTTDRLPVIEALESGLTFEGPSGLLTIDKQTHHATRTALLAECRDRGFELLELHPEQPPADTQEVCDLVANPDDNTHYVISVE